MPALWNKGALYKLDINQLRNFQVPIPTSGIFRLGALF